MYEIVRKIEYRGYEIQERRLTLGAAAVTPEATGGRKLIPSTPIVSIQWGIVKVLSDGREEEIALAWSEADARRQVDERIG